MAKKNQHFNIQELAEKWAQGKLTPEEQAYLEQWYAKFNDEHISISDSKHTNAEELRKAILDQVNAAIKQSEKPVRTFWLWPRIAAAASILLILSAGGYFLLHKPQTTQQTAQNTQNDITPGGNRAVLFAHGKRYVLDNARNGIIANRGNVVINKNADGRINYSDVKGTDMGGAMVYDTLIIPRGGQHELELADGSKIVLNADTKIRYPERFATGERRIELISGEAIFHVKHNAAIPFLVTIKGQTVKDIGTDFDINAYDDEPVIKTTLVTGSVEVSRGAQSKILRPGQQAVVRGDDAIRVQKVNTDQVVAWEKGQFYFEKTSLKELMRQVSRWYDIEVVYQGNVTDETYTGQPSRKENLSQMLKILQYGDVHFKIEPHVGNGAGRLIITP